RRILAFAFLGCTHKVSLLRGWFILRQNSWPVAFLPPLRRSTRLSLRHRVIRRRIMNLANNLAMLRCQDCGGIMKLVRSVPKPEGHSDLLFFACSSCGEVDVKEEKSAA